MASFRGTTAESDLRFKDKASAHLRAAGASQAAHPEFSARIDTRRVRKPALDAWVARRVTELLGGTEDEIVISMLQNALAEPHPDPRAVQVMLSGVLAIQEGLNPKLVRERLSAYVPSHGHAGAGAGAKAAA